MLGPEINKLEENQKISGYIMAEIDDIRNMNDQDLMENLDSTQKDLMNMRFRIATMQLSDTNSVKRTQRKIARIMTVIREREISERS